MIETLKVSQELGFTEFTHNELSHCHLMLLISLIEKKTGIILKP
jgi:hypothetical protein